MLLEYLNGKDRIKLAVGVGRGCNVRGSALDPSQVGTASLRRRDLAEAYIDRADPPRCADKLGCFTRKIPPRRNPALIPARQSADLAHREQYRGG
jgi:hypothetical protein